MGLPGAGKTRLAQKLLTLLDDCEWYNADEVRKNYNDWDFSREGRIRQAQRMRELADRSTSKYVICDFVAPLAEQRNIFAADVLVWVDTVKRSNYKDTDAVFEMPENYHIRVVNKDSELWAWQIKRYI
jgi:adenylylsulfate kinase